MELMARYEDNYFDLAIIDAPYGIGIGMITNTQPRKRKKRKENKYQKKNWDNKQPTKDYWRNIFRTSKNQIIFGANYFTSYLPTAKGWVFWDKKNACPSFSDGEFIFTSFNKVAKLVTYSSKLGTNGGKKRIHPCEKPIKLYEWLLMNYAKEGDKILDTHLGSGSLAIACHNLGYDLTACELDKEYFNAAMKRLKQHQQQLRLWH
jgi:site-specific DNA-methyltransferase (adenine-specific)